MKMAERWAVGIGRGEWHPPLARKDQVDETLYQLRQEGLTLQQVGARFDLSTERARQRIRRHERRLRWVADK
jgi:DNA-directed RNA polymerase sigma subunit (sigma70/sigma32)